MLFHYSQRNCAYTTIRSHLKRLQAFFTIKKRIFPRWNYMKLCLNRSHLTSKVCWPSIRWDVRERLSIFNKYTGELVGYADLEQFTWQLWTANRCMDQKQPLELWENVYMLVFMVRGVFTPLKFPYVQFPAANTQEADIFPLNRLAIKHLTRLGLVMATIICDGASDNRRMFTMCND